MFPNDKDVEFQTSLVAHVKAPMVFPDRTGTGELKLDIDDFEPNGSEFHSKYNDIKFNKMFRFPMEVN